MTDISIIALPPELAKSYANTIGAAKDSFDDKKVEEHMDEEKFTDTKEQQAVFERKGARKRKDGT